MLWPQNVNLISVSFFFDKAVDNEEVETHPNWQHFETVSCVQEEASCSGVDSES